MTTCIPAVLECTETGFWSGSCSESEMKLKPPKIGSYTGGRCFVPAPSLDNNASETVNILPEGPG